MTNASVFDETEVGFDYRAEAELADAIRFAIEELPSEFLLGARLEVDEERYDGPGIRRLYLSMDYPLVRRGAA